MSNDGEASNSLVTCTFKGTVTSVRVQGVGQVVLVEPSVFVPAQVRLKGAEIEGQTKLELDLSGTEVKYFNPVGLSEKSCDPYDVTYRVTSDKKYAVDIAQGGSHGGMKAGVPGLSSTCANGCKVVWGGAKKYVEIVKSGGPFHLTGVFLGDPEETCDDAMTGRKGAPRPSVIEVDGASGTLQCNGSSEPWTGHRQFIDTGRGILDLREIRIENGLLHVDMTYEPPPSQTMTWIYRGGIATVAAVVFTVVILRLTRRWRSRPEQPASVVMTTNEIAPAQVERIAKALQSAFPSESKLAQLLEYKFGKNLAAIAGNNRPLPDMIFDVVKAAKTDKWILDLVREAHADKPDNAELAAIAQELGVAKRADTAA